MKLLAYTQLWRRPELTKLAFQSINEIQVEGVEIIPFAVISEESMKPICEEYGVQYCHIDNLPLGRKHNYGLEESLKLDWDYCLNFGSDDLVSPKLIEFYKPYFEEGLDFFGLNDVYFMDGYTKRLMHYSYPYTEAAFGAGRVTSRKMIEALTRNGRLFFWEDERNKGLDNSSTRIAKDKGFKHHIFSCPEPVVVDVKTNVNIWDYDNYKGIKKPLTDLTEYFSKELLINLLNLKVMEKTIPRRRVRYAHIRAYHQMLLTVRGDKEFKVEFKGGYDAGEEGIVGGHYVTSDPDVIKSMEKHPLLNKQFFIDDERDLTDEEVIDKADKNPELYNMEEVQALKEKLGVKEEEPMVRNKEAVLCEVTTIQQAAKFLNRELSVPISEVNTLAKIKDWIKKNPEKVQFTKLKALADE
jgi:hypothetical protein